MSRLRFVSLFFGLVFVLFTGIPAAVCAAQAPAAPAQPESAPAVRAVARGLQANPNLKLMIEGHPDSVGDAGRLTTPGLAASKPIDSNDSPRGRAQDRRVEFVRP